MGNALIFINKLIIISFPITNGYVHVYVKYFQFVEKKIFIWLKNNKSILYTASCYYLNRSIDLRLCISILLKTRQYFVAQTFFCFSQNRKYNYLFWRLKLSCFKYVHCTSFLYARSDRTRIKGSILERSKSLSVFLSNIFVFDLFEQF